LSTYIGLGCGVGAQIRSYITKHSICRQDRGYAPHTHRSLNHAPPDPIARKAPVRAYIEELLPDVLEGRIEPGRVFDRVIGLDEVPDGYRAMNDREAIKVMVKP
jgi:hypothetical protein